jgi:AcrR family transcriptional regulator
MPKIVNHDVYRRELLEKAFDVFTRKGYTNVNMKEIATEIGVSTGTLYHYFPSKQSILAEMISWVGLENTEEYIQRTFSVSRVKDRFDMIVKFWREKGELYEKILLLGFDLYRNTDIQQWKTVYEVFAERYVTGMSERLKISRQFAKFIFIYFLGLSFHGVATDSLEEYNREIDFLDVLLRPLIVDAHEDVEKATRKFKKVHQAFLTDKDAEKTAQRFQEVFKAFLAKSSATTQEIAPRQTKHKIQSKAFAKPKKIKAKQKVNARKT